MRHLDEQVLYKKRSIRECLSAADKMILIPAIGLAVLAIVLVARFLK